MTEQILPLGHVADIRQGRYLAREEMSETRSAEFPIPVHGANGIIGWTNKVMYEVGVPLVTCRGSNCGMVLWAEGPLWVSNNAMAILPRNGQRKFAYYTLLNSPPYDTISGSAQPQITRGALEPRRYHWLDDHVQQGVADILSALDEKIELNRRTNGTLEALTRAIFRDWFVDFGPTRAKMESRAPYLAPGLWAQFPDELNSQGLPQGWERHALSGHVIIDRGISYSGTGLTDVAGGVPLHNLNSILEGGGYKYDGLKWYSGQYRARHTCAPGDLLVANTEQGFEHLLIGYAAIVPARFDGIGLFSHHLYKVRLRPQSSLTAEWIYFMLNEAPDGERIRKFANGTTVNMLPPDAFTIPEITVPQGSLVRQFSEIASGIRFKQEALRGESDMLAQARDELLPRLFDGRVTVAPISDG